MLLEKRFRTIDGFLTLLQKEWSTSATSSMNGAATRTSASDQRSPVFLLFIDCCFQLIQQFPSAFEFNQDLLLLLLDQLNACRFGTFLENNQRRRSRKSLDDATRHVWGHVAALRRRAERGVRRRRRCGAIDTVAARAERAALRPTSGGLMRRACR